MYFYEKRHNPKSGKKITVLTMFCDQNHKENVKEVVKRSDTNCDQGE